MFIFCLLVLQVEVAALVPGVAAAAAEQDSAVVVAVVVVEGGYCFAAEQAAAVALVVVEAEGGNFPAHTEELLPSLFAAAAAPCLHPTHKDYCHNAEQA